MTFSIRNSSSTYISCCRKWELIKFTFSGSRKVHFPCFCLHFLLFNIALCFEATSKDYHYNNRKRTFRISPTASDIISRLHDLHRFPSQGVCYPSPPKICPDLIFVWVSVGHENQLVGSWQPAVRYLDNLGYKKAQFYYKGVWYVNV